MLGIGTLSSELGIGPGIARTLVESTKSGEQIPLVKLCACSRIHNVLHIVINAGASHTHFRGLGLERLGSLIFLGIEKRVGLKEPRWILHQVHQVSLIRKTLCLVDRGTLLKGGVSIALEGICLLLFSKEIDGTCS